MQEINNKSRGGISPFYDPSFFVMALNEDYEIPGLQDVEIENNKITVITPTGDRPDAFALCQKWMSRQTLQPAQWIIVDDGRINISNIPTVENCCYVRREPRSDDPPHTLRRNMSEAMKHVRCYKVVIVEDDDWYHPKYLEIMAQMLDFCVLAGQGETIYYHLPSQRIIKNYNIEHASFCQTAFRKEYFEVVRNFCGSGEMFLDIDIWKKATQMNLGNICLLRGMPPLCIGIKGLPGRRGLTVGHNPQKKDNYRQDREYNYLRSLIEDDIEVYFDMMKNRKEII